MYKISALTAESKLSSVMDLDGLLAGIVTWFHTLHQKLCGWPLTSFCEEPFEDRAAREKGLVRVSPPLFLLAVGTVFFALSLGSAQAKQPKDEEHPFLIKTIPTLFEAVPATETSRDSQKLDTSCGVSLNDWLTVSANLNASHSKTQFFRSGHGAALFEWDSRIEFWMPPFRDDFSWGPYVRMAGITSNRSPAWENAWLAKPGFGIQMFPFSHRKFKESTPGRIFGPLRLFSEYNRLDYWGSENIWRPSEQIRVGADYWKALHVNNIYMPWWAEMWVGLTWESANEFDKDYNTVIFANSLRLGLRQPNAGILSMFSPYILLESSLTDNEKYYWENRLISGAGIRFVPFQYKKNAPSVLTRLVVFAEWHWAIAYYHDSAPSSVPSGDFVVGVRVNIGD